MVWLAQRGNYTKYQSNRRLYFPISISISQNEIVIIWRHFTVRTSFPSLVFRSVEPRAIFVRQTNDRKRFHFIFKYFFLKFFAFSSCSNMRRPTFGEWTVGRVCGCVRPVRVCIFVIALNAINVNTANTHIDFVCASLMWWWCFEFMTVHSTASRTHPLSRADMASGPCIYFVIRSLCFFHRM